MPDNEDLSALLARAEQAQQKLVDRRRQAEDVTIRAQDDGALIEVGVNGLGEVVEVAVNPLDVRHAEPIALAEAMLQAARSAQRRAREAGQA
jgi:DNA-binding protein YbaB